MGFITERRKRRRMEMREDPSYALREERARNARRNRGTKLTFVSFMAVAGCMAVMKAMNPDMSLRSPMMMFGSVFMACVIMIIIGRRHQ